MSAEGRTQLHRVLNYYGKLANEGWATREEAESYRDAYCVIVDLLRKPEVN